MRLQPALLAVIAVLLGVIAWQLHGISQRVPTAELPHDFDRQWARLAEDVRRLTDKLAGPRPESMAERCDRELAFLQADASKECIAFQQSLTQMRIDRERAGSK